MAYTPATILPNPTVTQFARPNAANPRLLSPIGATDTSFSLTDIPYDYTGSPITGNCLLGLPGSGSYVEQVWCPAGSISGTLITGAVRGVRLDGLDCTTGDPTLAIAHGQDTEVLFVISAVFWQQMVAAFQGIIASGGTSWKIGKGTDDDIYVYAYNADGNKPFWKYDKATNQWLFSNDGISSTPFGTGAGVTGGNGISVTAGSIDVDLADTVIFKDARTGNEQRSVLTKAVDGKLDESWFRPQQVLPTGVIQMWCTASAPTGWLICDGSEVSRSTYSALFGVLSDSFGGGDGSTTFNLPNFKNYSPFGLDTTQKVVIDDCESAWTQGSNVTQSLDSVTFKTGTKSVKLAVAAGAVAGQILGYKTISVANLYGKTTIGFWFRSDIALNAGDLRYQIDDSAAIASPLESIDLPAIQANVWTKVYVTLANPAVDLNLISHGLYQVNDKGAFNLWIDDIAYGGNYEIGATGGAKTTTMHVNEMPSHTHGVRSQAGAVGAYVTSSGLSDLSTYSGITNTAGGGLAQNNMHPYLTVNYIIKT